MLLPNSLTFRLVIFTPLERRIWSAIKEAGRYAKSDPDRFDDLRYRLLNLLDTYTGRFHDFFRARHTRDFDRYISYGY